MTVTKQGDRLIFTRSSGGLANAIASVGGKRTSSLWIGWPGISSDNLSSAEKKLIEKKLKSYGCYPVWLTERQVKNFYGGYCNDTIWPLFHYFQAYVNYKTAYWRSYKEVNEIFCETLAGKIKKSSTVWIHDYHLMLLPALLRQRVPEATIGYFLHIPFPSYEIFRLLPERKEVLQGILGADLIGFHIYDYARHFLSSILRILGIENRYGEVEYGHRLIKIDTFPLGIDHQRFEKALSSRSVRREVRHINKTYSGQKIILSVDRLDYSKGILQRLEAFELLLKEQPELHEKVSLVMVTIPSRIDVPAYKRLRERIEQSVGRINGKYTSPHWTPITFQFTHFDFDQIVALYRAADIALITPLRDGMNLVAKEFVVSKQNQAGVLILSEMAGAIDELQEALHVNPNNIRSIKLALMRALNMPNKEQLQRMKLMSRRLAEYSVQDWASDFSQQLRAVKKVQKIQGTKLLSSKGMKLLQSSYVNSSKRLIILDYDGTIQKFFKSPDPAVAKPSKNLLDLINQLAQQPATKLAIVSGRSRQALESWFGKLPVNLVAEHGAWIKNDGLWQRSKSSFKNHKQKLMPLLRHYSRRTVGSLIEEKDFSLVWHFRNVPPELAYVRNSHLRRELHSLLAGTNIEARKGNKIIEIKPRDINKGAAVERLLTTASFDFIICIGDDYTDEDMYKALPKDAYTIKVGLGKTNAGFRLLGIEHVLQLLKSFAE